MKGVGNRKTGFKLEETGGGGGFVNLYDDCTLITLLLFCLKRVAIKNGEVGGRIFCQGYVG
jgi:hypothetical protein